MPEPAIHRPTGERAEGAVRLVGDRGKMGEREEAREEGRGGGGARAFVHAAKGMRCGGECNVGEDSGMKVGGGECGWG